MKDYTIEPVTREGLIGLCNYYKGEKKNPYLNNPSLAPYDNIRAKAWYFEKMLCENLHTDEMPFHALHYLEYTELYPDYLVKDNLPLCLKDCILTLFLHKNELPLPDEFNEFFKKWKSKTL